MMKNKFILIFLISVVFLLFNSMVYYVAELNKNERVELELTNNLDKLRTHIEILLYNQKITADTVYTSTIKIAGFMNF